MTIFHNLPKVIVLEIQFFDKERKFVQRNFQIPTTADFKDFCIPQLNDENGNLDYEVFGAICIDKSYVEEL